MTIFDSAVSSLLVSQRSLTTISHNISNVNTEGYSRQRIELAAREAQFTGAGFLGKGVRTTTTTRVSNDFLINQLRSSTTAASEASAFLEMAGRLDTMLAEADTSLNISLQNFFSAVQDVNELPSSITARQVMIGEAEALVERFQFLDDRISTLSIEVQNRLNDDVNDINNIATAIAGINARVVEAIGISGGESPNDLLDQRDQMILNLSELVSVNTVEQDDGSINVFIGNGQPLVVGELSSVLGVTESYQGNYDITLADEFVNVSITDSIGGGSLGAGIGFQNEMLNPARAALGRIAIGVAETFNDQHRLGISLDGDVDTTFFSDPVASVAGLNGAPDVISATISNVTDLKASDYRLVYEGANAYILIRLSDNSATVIDTGGTWPHTTSTIDGFTITINSAGTAGDQYIIRPVIDGANNIEVQLNDPRKLAVGGPLIAAASTDSAGISTNIGNAVISAPLISRSDGVPMTAIPLTTDILLTFNAGSAAVQNNSGVSGAWTNSISNADGQNLSISVGGINILNVTQSGGVPQTITATDIDVAIAAQNTALTAAGISYTGTAVGGDLVFSRADGSTFNIDIANTFNTTGGFASADFATGTNVINNGAIAVTGTYDYTLPVPGGSFAYDPATENVGKSFTIALNANESVSFTISGFPQNGDSFVIENNTDADGDNRNGLLLSELQNTRFFDNGSATYQETYGQLVAEVGLKTRQTEINNEALSILQDQATAARESYSGVNLDEEAAELLRFQQSYTAAAQMINVADELFQSLISVFR
ncbi:MAG: flagellar hook-associated protein FlgK [Pseudomonadota bacterium]